MDNPPYGALFVSRIKFIALIHVCVFNTVSTRLPPPDNSQFILLNMAVTRSTWNNMSIWKPDYYRFDICVIFNAVLTRLPPQTTHSIEQGSDWQHEEPIIWKQDYYRLDICVISNAASMRRDLPQTWLTVVCCSQSPRETGPPDGFHANLTSSSSCPSLATLFPSLSLEALEEVSSSDTLAESACSNDGITFMWHSSGDYGGGGGVKMRWWSGNDGGGGRWMVVVVVMMVVMIVVVMVVVVMMMQGVTRKKSFSLLLGQAAG